MVRWKARVASMVGVTLLAFVVWLATSVPAHTAPVQGGGYGYPPYVVHAPRGSAMRAGGAASRGLASSTGQGGTASHGLAWSEGQSGTASRGFAWGTGQAHVDDADVGEQAEQLSLLWMTALAWLVPVGLGLLACGAVPPERVSAVIRTGWLALGVSVIGYWLCGFAFQFGGLGFVYDLPDVAGLAREWTWSPLDATWGARWGALGLEGYMLRGPASTPTALTLFFSQLPWITTAVAIPLWSLQGRARPLTLFLSSVLLAFIYTAIGNWTWGGGWLANLGANLNLGHGYVDWYGTGTIHLAGAASALAGMLAFGVRGYVRSPAEQLPLPTLANGSVNGVAVSWTRKDEPYVPMPPLHLPAMATLGAWLAVIGWVGWGLSTPVYVVAGRQFADRQVAGTEMLIGLMLAAAGGAMAALTFSWLTTGESNALMTARGVLGALIAVGAGLPFVPPWAALAIGAGAGTLVPLVHYLVEQVLRLDDPTSAVATHGASALWGLLAVGLFASGHTGQGWNQIGGDAYLGVAGQGITGYLAAAGYASDWPGQFQAQAVGAAAIGVSAFFLPWLLYAFVQGLSRAWQGEYTIRLPRRPRLRRVRPRTFGRRWPRIRVIRVPKPEATERARTERARTEAMPLLEVAQAGEAVETHSTVEPRLRQWAAVLSASWRRVAQKVKALAPRKRPARDVSGDDRRLAAESESSRSRSWGVALAALWHRAVEKVRSLRLQKQPSPRETVSETTRETGVSLQDDVQR